MGKELNLQEIFYRLYEKVQEKDKTGDMDLLEKAFYYSYEHHDGQLRNSGEPFFIHPYNVALILANFNMDTNTVIAGLLHDVIEDTDASYEDILEKFGEEIAIMVDGVTKLKTIKYKSKEESQAENLRKMVLAMAEDVRVIIVKLADRLHNMRTLEYMSSEKKKEKALETLEIYAPLADRMGISRIKWELEDLSLRYLNPEEYYTLVDAIDMRREEREGQIEEIAGTLGKELKRQNINDFDISGRPKSFYSTYKKMKDQNKTLEQVFDLIALRIIVDDVKECYEALGIVHSLWKPLPGRFKDYIAMPKANMYQSIHTTVIGDNGDVFEVQIRTWEMHRTAEYGIAAHWRYKEGTGRKNEDLDEKLAWFRQLLEIQDDTKDPTEFMDALKMDFLTDEVYVFTPNGDVINLPDGSTPIDFSYKIHTEVGNKTIGAKVDGRIVPLDFKLKTGSIVEAITSSNTSPSRDWLNIVQSSQARTKIRNYFKTKDKEENKIKGRDFLEREARRLDYSIDDFLEEEALERIAKRMGLSSIEDLYASIGFGSTGLNQVSSRLRENYEAKHKKEIEEINQEEKYQQKPQRKKEKTKSKNKQGIDILGIDNLKARFAKCCNPVPGDDVIGYITRGRGVTVHRSDCSNITGADEPGRLINVSWDTNENHSYPAEIEVKAGDKKGLIVDVISRLSAKDIDLLTVNGRHMGDGTILINLTVSISGVLELEAILKELKQVESVFDAYRVNS